MGYEHSTEKTEEQRRAESLAARERGYGLFLKELYQKCAWDPKQVAQRLGTDEDAVLARTKELLVGREVKY